MSDSKPNFPPADDAPRRNRPTPRDESDDDIIDLSDYPPVEEGSAVLQFSGRGSGPISGSSIVSWDELARAHGQPEGDNVEIDGPGEIDFDAASDIDLLRKVLSKDPPPSKIILKDPSSPETPALPADAQAYDASESALEGFDDASDELPGSDVSARRQATEVAGNESAPPPSGGSLGAAPAAGDGALRIANGTGEPESSVILWKPPAGASGVSSDLWSESSRVDLLGRARPLGASSGSLQHTDEVEAPPVYPAGHRGDDSGTLLGEPRDGDPDSSAVDLGSNAAINLPFPLGLDSSAGSSAGRRARAKPPTGGHGSDSGTVDLLDSSNEFDLAGVSGMSSVVRQFRTEADDLPPTTPLDAPKRGRAGAWVGGSLLGALATAAAAAGVWYAGYVPPSEHYAAPPGPVKPAATLPPAAAVKALADAEAKAAALARDLAAQKKLAAKAQAAAQEAGRAKSELDRIRGQLTAAKLTPADLPGVAQRLGSAEEAIARARQADQSLAELLARLKAANLDPASLDGAAQTLAQAKSAADDVRKARAEVDALKDADAKAAKLREQSEQAAVSARETEKKLRAQTAELAAAQAQLSDVVKQVTARLQTAKLVGANPPPGELLAALDRALQARPAAEPSAPRGVPAIPVPGAPAPANAAGDQLLATGLRAFAGRDYAAAIGTLTAAAKANPRDARAYYLLAVARMQVGESAAAYQLFTGARKVELLGETNADELQALLRQLTPTEQKILGRYRE